MLIKASHVHTAHLVSCCKVSIMLADVSLTKESYIAKARFSFGGRIQGVYPGDEFQWGVCNITVCHTFGTLSRQPRLPTAYYIWVLCRWKGRYFSENFPQS